MKSPSAVPDRLRRVTPCRGAGAQIEGVVRDGQGEAAGRTSPSFCGTANGCGRNFPSRRARAPMPGACTASAAPGGAAKAASSPIHAVKSLAAYSAKPRAAARPWNWPPAPSRPISCSSAPPAARALRAAGGPLPGARRNQPGPRRALDPLRGIRGRGGGPGRRRGGREIFSEQYGGGAFFTSLVEAENKDTTVLLPKPDWIEGRLLDPQDRPVAGALYRAENAFRGGLSLSGADGGIRLRRPKSGSVKVLFRDYRFRDALLTLRKESGSPVEVRFEPGRRRHPGRHRQFPRRPPCRAARYPPCPRPPTRRRLVPPPGHRRDARRRAPLSRRPGPARPARPRTVPSCWRGWMRTPMPCGWNARAPMPGRTRPRPERAWRPSRWARPGPWPAR